LTLDWPLAVVVLGSLASAVVGLRVVLPFAVGRSAVESQKAALEDVNKRLTAVEANLIERRMPGRLR
jgi:hypothetical protein